MNHYRVFMRILSLAALCSVSCLQAAVKTPIYEHIADLHLPTVAKIANDERQEATRQAQLAREAIAQRDSVSVAMPSVGSIEKFSLMYKIFADHAEKSSASRMTLNPGVVKDLEFYAGQETLLARLAKTTTVAGSIMFQRTVLAAETDVEVLKRRQGFMELLLNEPALTARIQACLQGIAAVEGELLWFWKEMEQELVAHIQKVFWQLDLFKALNQSVPGMTVTAAYNAVGDVALLLAREFLLQALTSVIYPKLIGGSFSDWLWLQAVESRINPLGFSNFIEQEFVLKKGKILSSGYKLGLQSLSAGLWLLGNGVWLFGVYKAVQSCVEKYYIMRFVEDKMTRIQALLGNVQKIVIEIEQYPAGKAFLAELEQFRGDEATLPENTKAFLAASEQLDPARGALLTKGRAMAAYARMPQAKFDLVGQLKSAGFIDAFVTAANLVREHRSKAQGYSFVQYLAGATPTVNLEGYWHPAVGAEVAVPNDISLGGAAPANMLVTGPNAGGKSTTLKAVMLSILLGQSFGIAPAKAASITPFALVYSYLNIADATGKESLFQAEMRRCKQLLDDVASLPAGKLSFAAMDEIFTGTNAQEGAAGAYGVAKKLASYPHSSVIIATHFLRLTELAQSTGAFKNYKVVVDRSAAGSISFLYKLVPGITDQSIALDLLAQGGFSADILAEAHSFMNQ